MPGRARLAGGGGGTSRNMAAPRVVPDSTSAARTTAAAVQLLRSAGKCAWLVNCPPVQPGPPLPARSRGHYPLGTHNRPTGHP